MIGEAITNAIQRGMDITGNTATKARLFRQHAALKSTGNNIPLIEQSYLRFATGDPFYNSPSKEQLDWALKYEKMGKPLTDEAVGGRMRAAFERMSNEIDAAIEPMRRMWNTVTDINRSTRVTPTGPLFKPLDFVGENVQMSDEDKLKIRRIDNAIKNIGWDITKFQGDLVKAQKGPIQASLAGLTDAYTDMLIRAAGGKKNETKQSIEDLTHKVEKAEAAKKILSEQRNSYLKQIAEKLNTTPENVANLTYGK